MAARILGTFVGGDGGQWRVMSQATIRGEGLPAVARLAVYEGEAEAIAPQQAGWVLRGATSYERYVRASEHALLVARQAPLGCAEARQAALIPIKKSAAWWELAQDERRAIFEERSRHIAVGAEYLPAIARRLYHGHDLGEPFDFLTWFEYAPADAAAFDELVGRLRETEEWRYVEREYDLRLMKG